MRDDPLVQELQSVTERSGPFVSLYLNSEAERELGPQEMHARWRNFRDKAGSNAIPEKALLLLDDVVEGSHRKGNGLVAITSGEELVFRRFLKSPVSDSIRTGAVPHLTPLFDHYQHHPSYAIVLIDRAGAEIHVVNEVEDDDVVEVEGDHDELRKVNPGGWSQRRFQNRAEDSWERNVEEVVKQLGRVIQQEGLALAIVMGDVRAKAFLGENAHPDIKAIIHELDVAPPTNDRLDEVREEVQAAVAALVGPRIEETVEKFLEERGQRDLAADGIEQTIEALRMSQVETLLITSQEIEQEGFVLQGDLTQGSLARDSLQGLGDNRIESANADDVLVRMALGTGAAICVIPELGPERGPTAGVGAILRFKTEN